MKLELYRFSIKLSALYYTSLLIIDLIYDLKLNVTNLFIKAECCINLIYMIFRGTLRNIYILHKC